ncbi:MAG TPA: cohesin domain-containing protein [Verrucomicrobiota bacterium]|nr:cohesin domain-containing protein [Verrucomicrobiota bacterium]
MRTGRISFFAVLVVGAISAWANLPICQAFDGLSVGDASGPPGGTVRLPVQVSDVSGAAAIKFIVNFDSDLLTLENTTSAELGDAFAIQHKVEEGRVIVALVRSQALAEGAGTLVYLQFAVNAGAPPGITAPVTIANLSVTGEHGSDLALGRSITCSNGSITVAAAGDRDTDGDGLPDWWEELYFGGAANGNPAADSDADGMTNWQEYIAGTNPADRASVLKLSVAVAETGKIKVLVPSAAGRTYRLLRSVDLIRWEFTGPAVTGTGTAIEMIDPDTGTLPGARFYRVQVGE